MYLKCLTIISLALASNVQYCTACHAGIVKRQASPNYALNVFFSDCMAGKSDNPFSWQSVVDFVVLHSMWYDTTSDIGGLCEGLASMEDETECWQDAMDLLVSADTEDSDLIFAKECVQDYSDSFESLTPLRKRRSLVKEEFVLDSQNCPVVSINGYAQVLRSMVTLVEQPNATLAGFESVIAFVRQEGLCPENCNCTLYTGLNCTECWPTRLFAMIRDSSVLKEPTRLLAVNQATAPRLTCTPYLVLNAERQNVDDAEIPYHAGEQVMYICNTGFNLFGAATLECLVNGTWDNDIPVCVPDDQLICGENVYITIRTNEFNISSFEDYNILLTSSNTTQNMLFQGDGICQPTFLGDSTALFYFELDECFPFLEVGNNSLTYKYTAWAVHKMTSTVNRFDATYCKDFCCTFNSTLLINSSAVYPMIRKVTVMASEGFTTFDIFIGLYQTPNKPFFSTNPSVVVPNYVYLKLNFPIETTTLFIQARQCWATLYENGIGPVYQIIENSCPVNNSFDPTDAIQVLSNYANEVCVGFRSFTWASQTGLQSIYVHCLVEICDSTAQQNCDQNNCPTTSSIGKRSIMNKDERIVSIGPISIIDEVQISCDDENGGCSDLCATVDGAAQCFCSAGKTLTGDGKLCIDLDAVVRAENVPLVAIAFLISVLLTAIGIILFWRRVYRMPTRILL